MQTEIDLIIGPRPDADVQVLRPVFTEHRRRFDDDSRGVRFYEQSIDTRESDPSTTCAVFPA